MNYIIQAVLFSLIGWALFCNAVVSDKPTPFSQECIEAKWERDSMHVELMKYREITGIKQIK